MAELLPLMERISGVMPDQSTEILTSVSLWLCILDGGFGRGDTFILSKFGTWHKDCTAKNLEC